MAALSPLGSWIVDRIMRCSRTMRYALMNRLRPISVVAAICAAGVLAAGQEPKAAPKTETKTETKAVAKAADSKPAAKLERGKYLVEEVARCQECHTPLLEDGTFDKTKWMKGATLAGIPAKPIEDWHQKAPDITSTSRLWERWKVEGFEKFMQTAKNPRGGKAGPPMPAYTLSAEDAAAMTAYLKSLQ